jgi:ATP-binding cassette subfamily F protein 3
MSCLLRRRRRSKASPLISRGDRIGLVGRNGAGKTTLLHVLEGVLEPMKGGRSVARGLRVALVEQVPPVSASGLTVHQEALSGVEGLIRLESRLHQAAAALAEARPGAAEAYAQLQHEFELAGGFTYQARLNHVLAGLGFSVEEFDRPVSQLSGGQRSRLGLAKALLAEPGLLLMDEPTNHLDLAGLQWLEDFLRRWEGALVVTSTTHFLDRAVNRIWYLTVVAFAPAATTGVPDNMRALSPVSRPFEASGSTSRRKRVHPPLRAGQRAEARGAPRGSRACSASTPSKSRDAVIKLRASQRRPGDIEPLAGHRLRRRRPSRPRRRGRARLEIALIGPNGIGKTTLLPPGGAAS